jgi:uncharacterized protein (TIGR03032 family)
MVRPRRHSVLAVPDHNRPQQQGVGLVNWHAEQRADRIGDSKRRRVVELPGYARGLAFCGSLAFVGLSKMRETTVFGGMPIGERREHLQCGVAVVDLQSARIVAMLEFQSGVEEIFDVEVLPGYCFPAVSGPYATLDSGRTVWHAPVGCPTAFA